MAEGRAGAERAGHDQERPPVEIEKSHRSPPIASCDPCRGAGAQSRSKCARCQPMEQQPCVRSRRQNSNQPPFEGAAAVTVARRGNAARCQPCDGASAISSRGWAAPAWPAPRQRSFLRGTRLASAPRQRERRFALSSMVRPGPGEVDGIKGADSASCSAGRRATCLISHPRTWARAVLLLAAAIVVLALITGVLAIAC